MESDYCLCPKYERKINLCGVCWLFHCDCSLFSHVVGHLLPIYAREGRNIPEQNHTAEYITNWSLGFHGWSEKTA